MNKKIFTLIFISILLTSCVSIKEVTNIPTPQPNFVTATLVHTKVNLIPTFSIAPSETTTPISIVTSLVNCTNAAILLQDVTIPDNTQVKTGETFTKTWEFQNTGTCPWTNYTMKFMNGDQMNAPISASIADTPPKEKAQISVVLTAPTSDGA